jgi:hypothetical protein
MPQSVVGCRFDRQEIIKDEIIEEDATPDE